MLLSDLQTGEKGIIVKVNGSGAFRKRILEMGFIKGKTVKVILNAPLRDPKKYQIMDYEVSLRKSEAELIEVVYPEQAEIHAVQAEDILFDELQHSKEHNVRKTENTNGPKVIKVALVGNPNAGKTSLFNVASGAHEHVGNYSGVTVDSKEGRFKHGGYTFRIVDLPGTYSISAYTPEELYVRQYLVDEKPDVVINVVAASNLERNLYLTTELIDMQVPMVMALNMYDELTASGSQLNHKKLAELIGVPIVPTVGKSNIGISDLFDAAIRVYEGTDKVVKHVKIYYGNTIENSISKLNIDIEKQYSGQLKFPDRYISVKLLEKDKDINHYVSHLEGCAEVFALRDSEVKNVETILNEDTESAITNARYGFVAGALKETLREKTRGSEMTRVLDAIVTNKYVGFPLFFFFLWLMFECTFTLGSYPMEWIEQGVALIGNWVRGYMPAGMLKDLIVDGIIGGVGGVIVFLPNILILYAFISFMEDSGYMARAAFIMDRVMHKMGLHGKSFIPLIMGFGCNVPAIMATRTIESRNSRMITMLINPFMSCSARLPVYLLFVGVFFGRHASLALFGLYFTGILLAVVSARLFKRFLFPEEDTPFVMELPPYRMPTFRSVGIHMWDKSKQYLRKMGGIILVASIIIWFLGYFPLDREIDAQFNNNVAQVEASYNGGTISEQEKDSRIEEMRRTHNIERQQGSYIGRIGQFVEPVMRPLGFDWKMSVSLVSGMAAKEVVVSTLGVLYTGDSEDQKSLEVRLANDTQPDGTKSFSLIVVVSFLLFTLIYMPCIATVAAIKEESRTWKWALFSVAYSTGVAWLVSFLVYQIGSLFF
ncbi:ferrous iron transport protein B [Dysgonomonas sp. PH5-45]|uniref:ferrous iron transport protein B n=1 Tax=unclassified Dysgonomonas TaxID=2630389 RepID=UPI00247684CF|nr:MULTISPECIES: ferrous iron transport protein B [unclassified Dysgonomonas]MDH6354540.1 ferrous iron transport protein B [Dysgonomonas sp. PH5-45]MDH6387404.1 ferrous iron transport protein B [Dysgonomonas sp. PH5-37]